MTQATFDLKAHLAEHRAAVDEALDKYLPPESGSFARLARATLECAAALS